MSNIKANIKIWAWLIPLALALCLGLSHTAYATQLPNTQTGTHADAPQNTSPEIPEEVVDGNLSVVESAVTGDKEFLTLKSKNGNTFFLVIDRAGDGENVYFLNMVDEADLMALIQDSDIQPSHPVDCICEEHCEAGKVNESCPLCAQNMTECAGATVAAPSPQPSNPPATDVVNGDNTDNAGSQNQNSEQGSEGIAPVSVWMLACSALFLVGVAGVATVVVRRQKKEKQMAEEQDIPEYHIQDEPSDKEYATSKTIDDIDVDVGVHNDEADDDGLFY